MNGNDEHYFVVVAYKNEQTGQYEFRLDDDTCVARFPDGAIWDGEEWRESNPNDETDWELSVKLTELLDGK